MDELGSFTLIRFYDGSLVWTILVRAYRYCPVHPESAIVSLPCGCSGNRVLIVGSFLIKLR